MLPKDFPQNRRVALWAEVGRGQGVAQTQA
jgi:hypothetical protein